MDGETMNAGELLREYAARASSASLSVEVPSFGNFNADTAIVGEYPGERELYMKMPFVGTSGKLLFDVLGKQGITRQHVYTTNVVRRRVTEAGEKTSVARGELEQWFGLLEWELSQLPNLKYVLLLGNYALQAIMGETGVTNWRGSVLDWKLGSPLGGRKEVKIIIANNPALVIREPKNELVFHFDMAKLKMVREGRWTPFIINPIINPSPREAIEYCTRMQDEGLPVSFDIEVISNETACIGVANSPTQECASTFEIALRTGGRCPKREYCTQAHSKVLRMRQRVKLVAQNGSFDAGLALATRIEYAYA
jgi:uracil-DNA glycosylase family 4